MSEKKYSSRMMIEGKDVDLGYFSSRKLVKEATDKYREEHRVIQATVTHQAIGELIHKYESVKTGIELLESYQPLTISDENRMSLIIGILHDLKQLLK